MIEIHLKKTITIWERGLYIIKRITIIVVILLISVLECTVYIKEKNYKKQQLLETTVNDIDKKEQEIKMYKEQLEEYKELNQKEEAQTTKIEQLETIIEKLDKELQENKQELENIKSKL